MPAPLSYGKDGIGYLFSSAFSGNSPYLLLVNPFQSFFSENEKPNAVNLVLPHG